MTFQLAIVLYPGMTALDAIGPYEVLRNIPGCDLRFVSKRVGPVVTDSGVLILGATHTFTETPAPDLVLVPGSEMSTTAAMADGELIAWLQAVHETTRWTTSVCSGALILAAAGILKGHPATTHWMGQKPLGLLGAVPRKNERIVRSGKIATAAGVSAGLDLGLWLVGEICGQERAQVVQLMIEYDPRPPFQTGHPSKAPAGVMHKARLELTRRMANPRLPLEVTTTLWRLATSQVRNRTAGGKRTARRDRTRPNLTP
jgi:transcriptional regulator GlxA family with amidase domain